MNQELDYFKMYMYIMVTQKNQKLPDMFEVLSNIYISSRELGVIGERSEPPSGK